MGEAKRRKRSGEVLHRKQLFGGKLTAEELHRKMVFSGHKCGKCGSPKPAMRVTLFAPASIAVDPAFYQRLLKIAQANEGQVPVVHFRYGKFIRMATVYACDNCKSEIEKWAAHTPSSWIVDFDRGPSKDVPFVQVPRA